MRVMAIDYGDSRTGVAVSDATLMLAGDAWVIDSKNMQETARLLALEAAKRDVSCIVVGYPKNMDGTAGKSAQKCEQLAGMLQSLCCDMDVKLRDERLTTMQAHKIMDATGTYRQKRKKAVDAVAASLILESYLSSLRARPAIP